MQPQRRADVFTMAPTVYDNARRTKRRLRLPLSGVNGARARAAPSRAQHIRDAKPGLLSKCLAVVGGTPRGKCGSKCNSSGEAVCNGATHMLCGTEHGCACVRASRRAISQRDSARSQAPAREPVNAPTASLRHAKGCHYKSTDAASYSKRGSNTGSAANSAGRCCACVFAGACYIPGCSLAASLCRCRRATWSLSLICGAQPRL